MKGFCDEVLKEMDNNLKSVTSKSNTKHNKGNKRVRHHKPYWTDELTTVWRKMVLAEKLFNKCKGPYNIKTRLKLDYINARGTFDKLLRKSERAYNQKLISDIEEVCTNNPKEFWKHIQNLGPKRNNVIPMKVRMGEEIVTDKNVVLQTWKNDFSGLFEGAAGNDVIFDNDFLVEVENDVQAREHVMASDMYRKNGSINGEITLGEVEQSVNKLKCKKACGIDNIPNEVLRNPDIVKFLTVFMNVCLKIEELPLTWLKAIIKPIPKSPSKDPFIPLNYRGISLLSCVSKVFSSIVNKRIVSYYESADLLVDEQNGFRKGRSCQEHLYVLTSVVNSRWSQGKSTFAAFIDLEKAFDSVDRVLLFYRLLCYNIDGKVYSIIHKLYSKTIACLKLNDTLTDWFDVLLGVRQGDSLSPTLFNLFINELAQLVRDLKLGVNIGNETVSVLLYADDMVFISKSEKELQDGHRGGG